MARMTIAQMREKDVYRLAEMHNNEPTENDIQEARKLFTSYYRLCGLCERNLYLQNDSRQHDSWYAKELEEKESKWVKRLDKQFNDFAGLRLVYCGYYPSIGHKHEKGGFSDVFFPHFYN